MNLHFTGVPSWHTHNQHAALAPRNVPNQETESYPKIQNYVGSTYKQQKNLRNIWGMSFRILLSSFQKEIFFLFLSLTNAVQPQNPFMECCPTTVHSVKAHSVFSDKYQHSYLCAFNTTPICVPASWRFVKWERSSRNSALLFTSCRKELQEGEEVEKPSYASVFL